MEELFLCVFRGHLSAEFAERMSIRDRRWWIQRLAKEQSNDGPKPPGTR